MLTVDDVARFLDEFAPLRLAESWDNVGLLLGDAGRPVERIMTCLTVTTSTVDEAIANKADLIVVHHPLPFAPLKKLTTATAEGRSLWSLAGAGISIYSPHTAFDSAPEGINQRLAAGLELIDIQPLIVRYEDADGRTHGAGRRGQLPAPVALADFAERVKRLLHLDRVQVVGARQARVRKIAIACGSAGEMLDDATRADCDCFLTGEARFHTALAADAQGLSLILTGHYASERSAVEWLASILAAEFSASHVWASRDERDPLSWV